MAFVTTSGTLPRLNLVVEEIIVEPGWRARLESIGGDRKTVIAWASFVALLVAAFALYPRLTSRDPVVAAPATAPDRGSRTASARVHVHVAGAVQSPGLYRLPAGARVADAIEAAGGPRGRADLDAVNLAEELRDGVKIEVPVRGGAVAVTGSPSASPAVVNLNVADQAALETIPGIGPVTATAILQHRSEIGSFASVEQLLDVTGIGPATLESLRPYVSV